MESYQPNAMKIASRTARRFVGTTAVTAMAESGALQTLQLTSSLLEERSMKIRAIDLEQRATTTRASFKGKEKKVGCGRVCK